MQSDFENKTPLLALLEGFFTQYHIQEKENIVVACSGWVDSMCLLGLVLQIHPKEKVVVGHFNHCLRGEESDGDVELVKNYCQNQGCCFETKALNIKTIATKNKQSIEETARKERYAFLETVRQDYSARFILVAHHLEDRIETCLFHLIRGTKLGWLNQPQEQSRNILRPLLHTTKKELQQFVQENTIPFQEDSSNTDTTFTRNYIRQNIVPTFSRINPSYERAFDEFLEHTQEVCDFLTSSAEQFVGEKNWFFLADFFALHGALQKEVIRWCYEKANSGTIGLSEDNLGDILKFLRDTGNYTQKELKNLKLEKKSGVVFIYFL